MFIISILIAFFFCYITSLLCFVGVPWHPFTMLCCCSSVLPFCVLLMFIVLYCCLLMFPFCVILGFVMFYYFLLALPCCVMLVLIGPLTALCWCLLVPSCCTLLVFVDTPLLHFIGVCRCPLVALCSCFIGVPLLCFIGVHWCSLVHLCCALLVFVSAPLLCLLACCAFVDAHWVPFVMFCWWSSAPPCYALLMFVNTPFAMFCWSSSMPPCCYWCFFDVLYSCYLEFQTSISSLQFSITRDIYIVYVYELFYFKCMFSILILILNIYI